jgi:hypothetical protein
MRKTGFSLICLVTILSGCGAAGERTGSTQISTEKASTYSSNAAGTTSLSDHSEELKKAAQNTGANSMATAANTAGSSSRTVNRQHLSVGQQVSLVKAEQVSESEYNVDRKIVRNAELDLEVTSPEQAQQKITSIAEMKGGFVVESNQSMSDIKAGDRDIVTMTLRVPSDKFGESLDEVRKTSSRVISETVKGEDVT